MKAKALLLFSITAFLFASCEKEQSLKPMAGTTPANEKPLEQIIKEANPQLYATLLTNQENNSTAKEIDGTDVDVIRGFPHIHADWSWCCFKLSKGICCILVSGSAVDLGSDPSGTISGVNETTIPSNDVDAAGFNENNRLTGDKYVIVNDPDNGPWSKKVSSVTATDYSDRINVEYVVAP